MSLPAKRPMLTRPSREAAIIGKGSETPQTPAGRVQLSLIVDAELRDRVDRARKDTAFGTIDRAIWLRQAVIEKLDRDGF